jgi:hypothetical protein
MKKTFTILVMLFTIIGGLGNAYAQTNVSGGIYSNTTWTKANSPYIVTDTVVVFPGVTLTIEPGVVVKFDDKMRIEVRQGSLIAQGTAMDSITFTSNSVSPGISSWAGIYFNMCANSVYLNYVNYKYSANGIYNNDYNGIVSITDSITIKHCKFYDNTNTVIYDYLSMDSSLIANNQYGVTAFGNTLVDSCFFTHNINYGVSAKLGNSEIISNCSFVNNTNCAILEGNCIMANCNVINNTGTAIADCGTIVNCNIQNNGIGVQSTNLIENCHVLKNQVGISFDWFGVARNCIIDSNYIYGIENGCDTVVNCKIRYNKVGIYCPRNLNIKECTKNVIDSNNIGIKLLYEGSNIYCNEICNNSSYNLYDSIVGGNNIDVPDNYWCTNDSASIRATIYDGYDNPNLSLVHFLPIDTVACYLTTGIFEPISSTKNIIQIYPNPASEEIQVIGNQCSVNSIEIFNLLGEKIYSAPITDKRSPITINIAAFAKGLYFLKVENENSVAVKTFEKE